MMLLFPYVTPDLSIYQTKNQKYDHKKKKNKGKKALKAHRGKKTKQKKERKVNLI
jgi:hypothetical protein